MIKSFYIGVLALWLSACGGLQKYEAGITQQATLIIRSVDVGPRFSMLVSKADLTAYEFGVLGAKDSENEGLQTIVLEVDSGTQPIKVSDGDVVVYSKSLYFSDGQTRDIRIRK